jgi:hypothetical protein
MLPELNEELRILYFSENPIYDIINTNSISLVRIKLRILYRFRDLYYSLRFKDKFRAWLWEKIREPKIRHKYSPQKLVEYLNEKMLLINENKDQLIDFNSVFDNDIMYPILSAW